MSDSPTTLVFDLKRLDDAAAESVLDGLRVDGEHVAGLSFDEETGQLRVEAINESAIEHIASFVEGMRQSYRFISRKVIRSTEVEGNTVRDIDDELTRSKDLHFLGEGLVGFRGPLLALFRFFERQFLLMAQDFEADENQFPTLIPREILEEVGYLRHFPQHVTFCCHLPGDLPLLESIAANQEGGEIEFKDRVCEPRHMLTPAVCVPCYRQQRGEVLSDGEVRVLTMQNQVFRYEGANFRPLTRGWDFTVRDIVFFGAFEDLQALRAEVVDRTLALCEEIGLSVTVELANDPFFLDTNREKAVYQRMGEVKWELLFDLPHRSSPLAASSFNLHRDFYTSVYDTKHAGGGFTESACMGFGIDRWVYGFLSQKGLNPAKWPAKVRSFVERKPGSGAGR